MRYLESVVTLSLDPARCNGCGLCVGRPGRPGRRNRADLRRLLAGDRVGPLRPRDADYRRLVVGAVPVGAGAGDLSSSRSKKSRRMPSASIDV
jgi:hypothetical protein